MPHRIGYDLEFDRVEQILPGDRLTVLVNELHLSANLPERPHPAADDVLCRVDQQKYAQEYDQIGGECPLVLIFSPANGPLANTWVSGK